jgi:uncharacterized phage protein gp47/JayE
MAGLTSAGLLVKTAAQVLADLITAAKAPGGFGPGVSTQSNGPLGKIFGILSNAIGLVWEVLQQVYDAFDPDQATGEALDNLVGIVGVTRLAATKTSGTQTCTGTNGTVIPLGSIVRITDGARFLTLAEVTIPIVETIDVLVEAENTGPIEASAGAVDEIVTIISGWTGTTNAADFVTGRNQETDAELRVRREASLQIIGAGTDGAIFSRLSEVEGVLAVKVKSNRTLTTDSDGIPPKAFETVIHPNTVDQDTIATEIFTAMPAGIQPYGSDVSASVLDVQGFTTTVEWTWAAVQEVWVTVTLTYTSEYLPEATGDQLVEDAVAAYDDGLDVGDDVVLLEILCLVAGVAGVRTASILAKVGGSPGGGDNVDIEMTFRQYANISAANVVVNSSPA